MDELQPDLKPLRSLDIYVIGTRGNRYVLFSPTDALEAHEAVSDDRVQHFVSWLRNHRNRLVAWVGRVLTAGHGYYVRLEDRIDPVERVLKAINSAESITVHSAPSRDGVRIEQRLANLFVRQRRKHLFWISIDTIVSIVVVAFTPILAPIPGPNIFFYYPFLRWLSHYRAIRGAAAGLRSSAIEYKSLPELAGLEENLQTPRLDRNALRAMVERLKIRGLDRFLERMV